MAKYIYPLLFIVILWGCKEQKTTNQESSGNIENKVVDSSQKISKKAISLPVKPPSHAEAIKTMYVTAKNGLFYREKPNGNIIDKFPYGRIIEILEYTGEKLEVEDYGNIIRGEWVGVRYSPNYGYYDIAYVFDGFLGNFSEIELQKETLANVAYYSTPKYSYEYEDQKPISIDSIIFFEIIDESQYEKLKSKSKDFIVKDTSNVERQKDTLWITTEKQIVELVDKPHAEELKVLHQPIGQIPFLNVSIIQVDFWESREYNFIDNYSGKFKNVLWREGHSSPYNGGYPKVSLDKKYILSLSGNPYEAPFQSEMVVYRINTDLSIDRVFNADFTEWYELESFWVSGNEFIVRCTLNVYAYDENSGHDRYFKATIK